MRTKPPLAIFQSVDVIYIASGAQDTKHDEVHPQQFAPAPRSSMLVSPPAPEGLFQNAQTLPVNIEQQGETGDELACAHYTHAIRP